MLLDSDWIRISDQVSEEWADHLTETLDLIGSTQKEGARLSGEEENPVNVEEVFKNTVKWLSATTNSIDNEDAKVVERVSNYEVIARQLYSVCLLFTDNIFIGVNRQHMKNRLLLLVTETAKIETYRRNKKSSSELVQLQSFNTLLIYLCILRKRNRFFS